VGMMAATMSFITFVVVRVSNKMEMKKKSTTTGDAEPPDVEEEESMDLFFDAPYHEIDHEEFKVGVKDGLKEIGCSDEHLKKVNVDLRPGSIVADIHGPTSDLSAVKACPLEKLSVLGYQAFQTLCALEVHQASQKAKAEEAGRLAMAKAMEEAKVKDYEEAKLKAAGSAKEKAEAKARAKAAARFNPEEAARLEREEEEEAGAVRQHLDEARMAAEEETGESSRLPDLECPSCGNVFMFDAKFCRNCGVERVQAKQGELASLPPAEADKAAEPESQSRELPFELLAGAPEAAPQAAPEEKPNQLQPVHMRPSVIAWWHPLPIGRQRASRATPQCRPASGNATEVPAEIQDMQGCGRPPTRKKAPKQEALEGEPLLPQEPEPPKDRQSRCSHKRSVRITNPAEERAERAAAGFCIRRACYRENSRKLRAEDRMISNFLRRAWIKRSAHAAGSSLDESTEALKPAAVETTTSPTEEMPSAQPEAHEAQPAEDDLQRLLADAARQDCLASGGQAA